MPKGNLFFSIVFVCLLFSNEASLGEEVRSLTDLPLPSPSIVPAPWFSTAPDGKPILLVPENITIQQFNSAIRKTLISMGKKDEDGTIIVLEPGAPFHRLVKIICLLL